MVIILMGVTGVGKTTIGQMLAHELGWSFYDGDDFHPQANIDKIRLGIPLTDEDRIPWLEAIRRLIASCLESGKNAVMACSALKESYRQFLLGEIEEVKFVYLTGDYELIRQRLKNRHGHFAGQDILASQFATLEEPKDVLSMDVSQTPEAIVEAIRREVGL